MIKKSFIFILTFVFISCSDTITKEDLKHINGYWEITKVLFPDGKKKEYKVSPSIDFFELKDVSGYRKKVNPKFNGSFETSDDAELFEISQEEELFQIIYKNNLATWQETILFVNKERLILLNNEGVQYHYKRFEPINITP